MLEFNIILHIPFESVNYFCNVKVVLLLYYNNLSAHSLGTNNGLFDSSSEQNDNETEELTEVLLIACITYRLPFTVRYTP